MTTDSVDLYKVQQLKEIKKALFGKYDISNKDPIVKACQWAHRERLVTVRPLNKATCNIELTATAKALIDEHGHLVP